MLPSLYQLPTNQILYVLHHGRRTNHAMLQLRYCSTAKTPSRLGIIVSKTFDKKAVGRHRVKRQLAMVFLPYLIQDAHPKDIVCKIVKTNTPISSAAIKQAVDAFFTSAV